MGRKIIILCVVMILILSLANTAFAVEKTGSVSVTLADQGENVPVEGAVLDLYFVAKAEMTESGELIYSYTKDFEGMGVELDDHALSSKLDAYISANDVDSIKMSTDKNGSVTFDDLSLGLYYVKQNEGVGGYSPCKPFLVTVPFFANGVYVYDVNATPKTEIEETVSVTVRKVWNTDNSTCAAESVTVQLLRDGAVVKTAILNEENDWQITYTDMPKSDAYSIVEIDVPKGFTATYSQSEYTFTVTNTSTLIQTGQLVWPILVLAAAGMLLISIGVVILPKKRKTDA